jgi:hypothetical protein
LKADIQIGIATEVRIMKIDIRSRSQAAMQIVLLAGVVLSSLLLPSRAAAALGGDVTSVETDQQQMKAKRAVRATASYLVHEITTPYGTVVREYVSPDGKVFGVAWRGPFLPNFQQLLGDSYATFAQAAQDARSAQPRRSRNAPLAVAQPNLVMHSGGHTRAYVGQAYIPGMIPQGVDAQEIR